MLSCASLAQASCASMSQRLANRFKLPVLMIRLMLVCLA